MDLARYDELRARAAAFVDDVLIPLEVTAEVDGGGLSPENQQLIRDRSVEAGLQGAKQILTSLDGRIPR